MSAVADFVRLPTDVPLWGIPFAIVDTLQGET